MGFFDRLTGKKTGSTNGTSDAARKETPSTPSAATVAGGVLPQLAAAREKLAAKDVAAAMAIYEQVIANAGDRADVLLTASGDLGSFGQMEALIELVAPRYDTARHGHGPGLNLLQAYLATGNAEAAQHVLDLLFDMKRPELEERLIGFSRAVSELVTIGHVATPVAAAAPASARTPTINIVTMSKPMWFYGLEPYAATLLPQKSGKLRRVAFTQTALLGIDDLPSRAFRPEDKLGRFTRGLPLWFAETFGFSEGYEAFAALGVVQPEHYALFGAEWTADNIRQLNDSTEGGLDFVVTTSLRSQHDDFELTLRIWEVKKTRQLKTFSVRWTPATAEAELTTFHDQICRYMEWKAMPLGVGLPFAPAPTPTKYLQSAGASLSLFLHGKELLPASHAPANADIFLENARANPNDARSQLLLVTAIPRLQAAGHQPSDEALKHARDWLSSSLVRGSGLANIEI